MEGGDGCLYSLFILDIHMDLPYRRRKHITSLSSVDCPDLPVKREKPFHYTQTNCSCTTDYQGSSFFIHSLIIGPKWPEVLKKRLIFSRQEEYYYEKMRSFALADYNLLQCHLFWVKLCCRVYVVSHFFPTKRNRHQDGHGFEPWPLRRD